MMRLVVALALLPVVVGCAKEPPPVPVVQTVTVKPTVARECVIDAAPWVDPPKGDLCKTCAVRLHNQNKAGREYVDGLRRVCRESIKAQGLPVR